MITDGKKWHYLAVKSLSALLRGVTSNHNGDFHCLNCFNLYSTKNKLKKHEKVCNDHDYCYVEMPNEYNKILKYNYGKKLLKALFMIYAELGCLLEKMHSCQNNPEKCKQKQMQTLCKKKLSICFLVIQYLQIVHLIQQKTNLIFTKVKIVWKGFVKI